MFAAAVARRWLCSAQAARMSSLNSSTVRIAQTSSRPMVCSAIASVAFSPPGVAGGR
ncbi:hypothetical protein STENM36S_02089 [Streptomyces tendae]